MIYDGYIILDYSFLAGGLIEGVHGGGEIRVRDVAGYTKDRRALAPLWNSDK